MHCSRIPSSRRLTGTAARSKKVHIPQKNTVTGRCMIKIPLIISIIVIAAAVIFFWGWFSSDLIIKQTKIPLETRPDDFGLVYEEVRFKAEDGTALKGWFIPYHGSAVTIVVLHGWGANKGSMLPSSHYLHHRGQYNLLLFDLRNHGESEGSVTSFGPLEKKDLRAAVSFLKQKHSAEAQSIGVFGSSLGGTIGILTAAEMPAIDAVVAESAFTDPRHVIVRYAKLFYRLPHYPIVSISMLFAQLRLGVWFGKHRAVDAIARIAPRPVFIIQGEQDVRMPVQEGTMLVEAAGEPKSYWSVPDADHGEVYLKSSAEYERKVLQFFNQSFSQAKP
ncbi:MAG: alpha/beta fold hydrolase [Elusimicrobia bacterium]|nr:alpha/beta fold hydrolase [Elusimicrobiota bacterium]